jgi:glycosyltransferase involved in cell wall biosynthesis
MSKGIPITVLILTKNEEQAISECINSVQEFSQVLVFDSNSVDRTVTICEELGATVINFDWDGKYPKKKQSALSSTQITNDWVLFLDADERVTQDLVEECRGIFKSHTQNYCSAFEISISYYFMGQVLRHGHQVKKIALVNRFHAKFPVLDDLDVENMWEVEGHYQPHIQGITLPMRGRILHQDPDPLFDYFARHNRYSDWEAKLRTNEDMRRAVRANRTKQGRFFDLIPAKPLGFFLYSYVLRNGWRDGKAGFNYAVALSFYYWQISLKTWELK